jgi:hypothetical protein
MAGTRPDAGQPCRKRGVHGSEPRAGVSTNVPAERASVSSRRTRRSGGTMTLVQSLTSLTMGRQAAAAALMLAHWRNGSLPPTGCLTNVLDHVTDAHRALGWPRQLPLLRRSIS